MSKFIQIISGPGITALTALDDAGNVWKFNFDSKMWEGMEMQREQVRGDGLRRMALGAANPFIHSADFGMLTVSPAPVDSCTGHLVHDEYTYCPIHDGKITG